MVAAPPFCGVRPLAAASRPDHPCPEAAPRLVAFYDRGLARLEDRWIGTGETGERFLTDDHLYAADLDLFGRGSLFELLSLARTRTGEETLAGWLKHPAAAEAINGRHAAIDELRYALDSLGADAGRLRDSRRRQPGRIAGLGRGAPISHPLRLDGSSP